MAPVTSGLPLIPKPGEEEIHLWQCEIRAILPLANASELELEEQAFLEKVKSPKAREEYLVSRWSTRQILSRYLSITANQVRFQLSSQGKPSLLSNSGLTFNRSHSGGWWVLAVARNLEIGVDIENSTGHRQLPGIVRRWFTLEEQNSFENLPEESKPSFFYARWTEKEAVMKAAGLGLSHLNEYEQLRHQYGLIPFSPAPEISGCVAHSPTASGHPPQIRSFPFDGLLPKRKS